MLFKNSADLWLGLGDRKVFADEGLRLVFLNDLPRKNLRSAKKPAGLSPVFLERKKHRLH